jgi:hypothetical protein
MQHANQPLPQQQHSRITLRRKFVYSQRLHKARLGLERSGALTSINIELPRFVREGTLSHNRG